MKRNKWKSWLYLAKRKRVRNRIKRKTNKRNRFLYKMEIKRILREDY